MGFTPSKIDPCIFHRDKLTVLVYVDDCLIFAEDKKKADDFIHALMEAYDLTDEGELGIDDGKGVSSYLGVQVVRNEKDGTVELSQPYLIQRILEKLGSAVTDANTKKTPAQCKTILHKDENGPFRKQSWNYRSVIGMLNFLAASTRPDILFAVHQCARFSADPKLIHEQAVKRICRYLKGTSEKGIILKPEKDKGIECYVDADFAGNWQKERADDISSVLSRTGYAIFYMGCPILWVSKLQTEITLSTTETEYVALSQSMRDVIPFMGIIEEINEQYSTAVSKPVIKCTLFEDNNGAIKLATDHKYRPRTKHIALKYHHFREHVKRGLVSILPIDTHEQVADQFTKPLDEQTFCFLRYKLMGW
jgi:hypothetical protein